MNSRTLLLPFSWLYAAGASGDRRRKLARRYTSSLPVISVGNLSVGGTGKTPMVIELAARIQKRRPVLVLSRGYGRVGSDDLLWKAGDPPPAYISFGDEPTLISTSVTSGAVAVGNDRAELLRKLEGEFPNAVVLLDDGFQHYQLERDLDLVIVDERTATLPWPLPAGILREPASALARAGVVLTTSEEAERFAQTHAAPGTDIIAVGFETAPPVGWKTRRPLDTSAPTLLVTGIAQPQRVVDSLASMGIEPTASLYFRDHVRYLPRELSEIHQELGRTGARQIITTAKDAVKLQWHTELAPLLHVIDVNVIISDPDRLMARLWSTIESKKSI